jgi:polysaccharide export outer membrane protein
MTKYVFISMAAIGALSIPAILSAQGAPAATSPARETAATVVPANGATVPPDYVVGPDDVLQLVFWREKDMSAEVTVRPDGMISVPLVNEVTAAGLTPDQLRERIMTEARRYTQDPTVTVVVKQINSRRVFITGEVAKPGPYPLTGPISVVQLIALAGGLQDFADSEHIRIMRKENGKPVSYKFNYKSVMKGKDLQTNIDLKPGDTLVVP